MMTPLRNRETGRIVTPPDVSIILPVYRNADTLEKLHGRISQALGSQKLSFEMICVIDACPSGSQSVIEGLAQRDARVRGFELRRNCGQHAAVLVGLAQSQAPWTVIMDADLQDPPEAIPVLLARAQETEGVAAVFASRRGRYESLGRHFTSRLFKALIRYLCNVPPGAGIFVAINSTTRETLLAMKGPYPFIVAMIGCTGLPLESVPVMRSPRENGSSAYSAWGRLKSGWRAVWWAVSWKCRKVFGERTTPGGSLPAGRWLNQISRRIPDPVTAPPALQERVTP
jgi:hypothetical protein